jgi:hypothetical protein
MPRARRSEASAIGELILVRLSATGGATRTEITADLAPLFAHKLSPADWRRTAERETGQIIAAGLASDGKGRLAATDAGHALAARALGRKTLAPASWPELRDVALVAKGLGLDGEAASRLKVLARIDGLRTLIVQKAYGLAIKKNTPPAKLRAQLAVLALERAFGNKIKAGLGKGSPLPAKAGRLLAAQLSLNPRAFASDAKLIAELAAEHVGAVDTELDALRTAILRSLGAKALEAGATEPARPAPKPVAVEAPVQVPPADNDRGPVAVMPPRSVRPDLGQFADAVRRAASSRAEGWPGNRKAYISHVWAAVRASEPRWGLSEIEFKCMLAEAHRLGAIVLANADLKNKSNMAELESSAVPYKNTVWHFVRVEE